MTPNLSLFHLTTPGAVQVLTRPENLKFYSDPRFEQIFGTLADLLPSTVQSHFQKRCIGVTSASDGRAEVRFADGSSHVADLVIGADGIKSAVRSQGTSSNTSSILDNDPEPSV